jgi:uridine kinase
VGHDPLTGADHRKDKISARQDAILIVDSVFAFRPEYNDCWEYRIWLEADSQTALRRGIARDCAAEGAKEAARVHRDRYHAAEMIYLAEVDPQSLADVIIDNNDLKRPRILTHPTT